MSSDFPDFEILKNLARSHFLHTVNSLKGDKLLMIDPELLPFFRIMIGRTEKGLIKDTILLEPECMIDIETPIVLFALKSNITLLKTIVRLIRETQTEKQFIVYLCPRQTAVARQIFEEGKIEKVIQIHELPYEFIPLEKDVLTLDDNLSFRNLMLGQDYTTLQLVKQGINRIESLYGNIPLKYAKGSWSCIIHDSLLSVKNGNLLSKDTENDTNIDALLLLDRSTDLITPLLTQMTYEGIIDEFYPIKCGSIDIDKSIVEQQHTDDFILLSNPKDTQASPEDQIVGVNKKTVLLTSHEDVFFGEIRDKNYNIMKDFIPKKYDELKKMLESKDSYKTLAEMTEYMKRLRDLKIPQLHVYFNLSLNLLEQLGKLVIKHSFKQMVSMEPKIILADSVPKDVLEFLDIEIAKCEDKPRLLRLLCLISIINNGIPKDNYASLTKEFVDAFGISELMRIMNLERVGILKKKESGGLQWGLLKSVFFNTDFIY